MKKVLSCALTFLFALFWFVPLIRAGDEPSSMPEVVFADTEEIPWMPVEGVEGARWKLLRTDPKTKGITALVQFPAGSVENPHHHTFGHWIYIINGAKVVENLTAKKEFTLSEGMMLYTPAGNVHRIRYLSRCTFLFVTDGPFDMIWEVPATTGSR